MTTLAVARATVPLPPEVILDLSFFVSSKASFEKPLLPERLRSVARQRAKAVRESRIQPDYRCNPSRPRAATSKLRL